MAAPQSSGEPAWPDPTRLSAPDAMASASQLPSHTRERTDETRIPGSQPPPFPSGDSQDDSCADKLDDLASSSRDHASLEIVVPTDNGTGDALEAHVSKAAASGRFSRSWLPTGNAWKTYFTQEIAGDTYLEAQLLAMTIATGILDAMTYTTFRVFTSKQTGNTLFLALYAFQHTAISPGTESNVGVSMGVFILGAIFFGHIGRISQQRRRIWLLISNLFQTFLIFGAAAIRYWATTDPRPSTGPTAQAILALLSLAESGQIATALNVGMPELNTTMITGALIQLCTDRKIWSLRNAKRNRRVLFIGCMLVGCFIGAALVQHASDSAALVVVGALKGVLVLSFLCNRGWVKKPQLELLESGALDGGKKVDGAVTPVGKILWGD